MQQLGGLVATARDERKHFDAGEARQVASLIEQARANTRFSTSALESLARTFADQVDTHQRVQHGKQVRAVFGADVLFAEPNVAAAAETFIVENVALIRNMPVKTLAEIEGIVTRGVPSGALHRDIASDIRTRIGMGKTRARVIARDQISKFYGQVARVRQGAMGVTHFIWRTAGDERVRDEHISLDGRRFAWATGAPGEGAPGEPVQCRCYADPDFDDLVGSL